MQLFYTLGAFAYRHRWVVISLWLLLLVVSAPLFFRAGEQLQFGGLTSPRMESVQARELLERELGAEPSNLVVLFRNPGLAADDPEFNRQVDYAMAGLRDAPGVQEILSHQTNPRQVSADGHTVYELVVLSIDAEQAARDLEQFTSRLRDPSSLVPNPHPLEMWVTGGPIFFSEVERLSHQDLLRAEIIAFPFAAAALLLVFGSLVATGLPIAVGGASVVVIMAGIALMSRATDLSIFVINVATMLGLGLGLDYSLFIASRFREELGRRSVGEAMAVSVATAGKAVLFSGLAVMIGLLGLASFEFVMLRSLGLVGVMGVAICMAAALTLLPAVLGVLGHNVNRWPVLPNRRGISGFWERTAAWVMRHPVKVFLPTMALLVLLGIPFLHVRFSAPDAYILPPHLPSRQALELLRSEFGDGETAPIVVVVEAEGGIYEPENLSALYDFTHTLAADSRVSEIESIVNLDPRITKAQYRLIYADPSRISDRYGQEVARRSVGETATVVKVATHTTPVSEESKDLVRQIRQMGLSEGMSVQVTGTSAEVLDVVGTLYSDAPYALGFIVIAIYGILLVLFRSVVLPAKALLMNTLSILASYGALVFIFQDGNFQSILGFESTGTIEASMPVILFCIVFGLSMDYEVFLLTRIKEEYDRTGDNAHSVAKGLERSGRLITSAAIIVVVVGAAFAAADIVIIKALGLGIAISVFLDATVVRTLLVPATMRLLGKWNWWMPGWGTSRQPSAIRYQYREGNGEQGVGSGAENDPVSRA